MAIKFLQNTEYVVSHSDCIKMRATNKTLTELIAKEKIETKSDIGWYDYIRATITGSDDTWSFSSATNRTVLKLPKNLASLKITSIANGYNYALLSMKAVDENAPVMSAVGELLTQVVWKSSINEVCKPEPSANFIFLLVRKSSGDITPTEAYNNLNFEAKYMEYVTDKVDIVEHNTGAQLEKFALKDFKTLTLSFNNASLASNTTYIGFEIGKTYKISVSMETTTATHLKFYLRQVASNNQPNIEIKDKDTTEHALTILAGEKSDRVFFTPNSETNYQYVAAWHVNNANITKNISIVIQEVLSLKDYIDNVKDIAEDANMDVFVSQSEMTQGYCINANENNTQYAQYGETYASTANYFITDFVNIKGAKRLVVVTAYCRTTDGGRGICGCVLYDASKQPLTGYGFYFTGVSEAGERTFEIEMPNEAVYVRNTTWSANKVGITAYFDKGYALPAALEEALGGDTKEDVVTRNAEAIEAIYAAKKRTRPEFSYDYPNHMQNFCLAHITDMHCDTKRYENFRKFIDAVDGINAAVNTGDLTIVGIETQFNTIVDVEGTKDVMQVVGNHDKLQGPGSTTNVGLQVISNATVYSRMKYVTPTSGLYYYKDFTETEPVKNQVAYKVRVIVLNQYDADGVLGSAINDYTTYSQAQINWFIGTLQDAITNGYAVMVCMHTSDRNMGRAKNDGKFYDRAYDLSAKAIASGQPDAIIEDIINVFRHGGTLSKSYTWSSIGTVSVNVTFATTGTFIAYVTGHAHRDIVAYSKNYPDQLYLGGNCGNCYSSQAGRPYGTEMSALPRQVGEKSEDCFNVYGINLEEKTVRVVRVGASINDHMEKVDYAIYDFEPTISSESENDNS